MSQNSSWAKLVSNNSSEEADDQNPWEKVQDQKNKKSLKNASQRKSDSNKSKTIAEPEKTSIETKEVTDDKTINSEEAKNPSPVRTNKIEQKKIHSPAKIVNTPARSENVDTAVDSKKNSIEPLIASWPSLEAASNIEYSEREKSNKIYSPQSPVPSSIGDNELLVIEKGKKWSKLPVQIRYNASNSKNTRVNRDKSSGGKKGNQQFAPHSSPAPQNGEKPKQFKKNLRASETTFNDNASTQSNQSSSGRSLNNRHTFNGMQNRNTNPRKPRDGNVGHSNSYNGNMVQQAEQVPYFYTYYQPLMAGGVPPMVPAPYIDPSEQDPSNSLEMVKMWIRGQIEYYYSVENLLRDTYFRKQMSSIHGGVPLSVIAGFNRVKSLLEYAKPYYQFFKDEEDEPTQVDSANMMAWLEGILKSSIESSAYLHLIHDSDKLFVGIKEGWEYWIISEYPISPTKTASDSFMSSGESGKVNEETDGREVSSFKNIKADAESNSFALKAPKKHQSSAPVSIPSPPVTPSNPRACSNDNSLLLEDTLSDAEWDNIFLVIPSGVMQVDSHQAEWLHQGLLSLEKKLNGDSSQLSSLAQTPRFWASSNKASPPIGWYWMSNQSPIGVSHDKSNNGADDLQELPVFDHPSCRFFKDCGFSKVQYKTYYQNAVSGKRLTFKDIELKNTGTVSSDHKAVLYSFWSCLLRSQFHNVTYNLFRDLALSDAKIGEPNGLELLRQIFLHRCSVVENEQARLVLMKELDRVKEGAINESKPVPVGH